MSDELTSNDSEVESIELSARESRELLELGEPGDALYEEYRRRRFDGQSHNMAMILVTREGPVGKVSGTRTPTPTIRNAKLKNVRRRYRGGAIQDL